MNDPFDLIETTGDQVAIADHHITGATERAGVCQLPAAGAGQGVPGARPGDATQPREGECHLQEPHGREQQAAELAEGGLTCSSFHIHHSIRLQTTTK